MFFWYPRLNMQYKINILRAEIFCLKFHINKNFGNERLHISWKQNYSSGSKLNPDDSPECFNLSLCQESFVLIFIIILTVKHKRT